MMDDQIFQTGMSVACLADGHDGHRHAFVAVAAAAAVVH
jgi:hypothetical protein